MNYYELLEVSTNASPEVIKAAYKSLMQRNHPDKNPNNREAEERSILLAQAFEILSDESKRCAYNLELKKNIALANSAQVMSSAIEQSPLDRKSKPFGFTLYLIFIVGLAVWFVWISQDDKELQSGNVSSPQQEVAPLSRAESNSDQNQLKPQVAAPIEQSIPNYLSDIKVNLVPVYSEITSDIVDAPEVLSIGTVGVVVGAFEADKFIRFLEDNKPLILMKLSKKLETASVTSLKSNMGEQHLKSLILNSLGEITQTDRFAEYPVAGTNASAHYGVVGVSLPNYFSVNTAQDTKP